MFKLDIKVTGTKDWVLFLSNIPKGVTSIVLNAFAKYVVGDSNHGLRHYPQYKYVSRKSAYGRTFFSLAQQRWFFASGAKVGNFRTGAIAAGWKIIPASATRIDIVNSAPGVTYTMGQGQAAQPRKVGWRTAYDVVMSNFRGGVRAAQIAVDAWLHSQG